MVAIDDDVVCARVDGVDDRELGRPDIDQRLGMALGGVRREHLAVDRLERQALRPDRSERRIDDVAGMRPVLLRAVDR